jgi:hypothetical protein
MQPTESDRTLGAFPGDDDPLGHARALDDWLDGRLDVAVAFAAAGLAPARRRRVFDHLAALWDAGFRPVLTWEPFDVGDADDPAGAVANGRADDLLDAWATAVADWVDPPEGCRELVLRPAHEMNGWWYPWSAGAGVAPGTYRRMWRRLHDAVAAAGAGDRVRWLWCPNAESAPDIDPLAYYPGDDVVDRVGVDGYNFGDSRPESAWRDPEATFQPTVDRLRARLDAPLDVPEVGCSSVLDGDHRPAAKAAWVERAFDRFDAWDVRSVCWFDADKETDWSVLAPGGGDIAPPHREPVTAAGRSYVGYPAFRRAAVAYRDRTG